MSAGRRVTRFTARSLMQPLRATLGCRETVAAACTRMRAHSVTVAPVIEAGRAAGLLALEEAERAVRHGLGAVPCGRLVAGAAAFVAPGAGPKSLHAASRGVCPGLLVRDAEGTLLGVILRASLDARLERLRRSPRPPVWLTGRDVRRVMKARLGRRQVGALRAAGRVARIRKEALYLVGGVVRDLLRGRDGQDLDLVVQGSGIAFARALAARLGGRVTTHDAFGTAVLGAPDVGRIDVATARRERYAAPAALPQVSPGSMLDDMMRRDVTINGMAVRLDGPAWGRLRDDLGGERDLALRTLRVVHLLSLVDDPTRALRIVRLAARLGFALSKETGGALALAASHGAFESLSGERLAREFSLFLDEPDPARAIGGLARADLLRPLGTALGWDRGRARAVGRLVSRGRSARNGDPTPDLPLGTLMILSEGASAKQRIALADRLALRGRNRAWLLAFAACSRDLRRLVASRAAPSRIARVCDRLDPTTLLAARAVGDARLGRAIERYVTQDRHARSALTGEDLMRMGVPRGPALGRMLDALRRARIDGRAADLESERRLVRRMRKRAISRGEERQPR